MNLESVGILIGLRPFEERDSIATIFTRDFGIMRGMMRAAQIAKKNKPIVGQMGVVSWNARLDSQFGVFHFESQKNLTAPLMGDSFVLAIANAAFELLGTLLPERENYEKLYNETELLLKIIDSPPPQASVAYLAWEIFFLRELGYALDLGHCSGCGCVDNLTHISQRTGRAVCADCAAPWLSQCLPLPADLATAKFFLEKAANTMGAKIPLSRMILGDMATK